MVLKRAFLEAHESLRRLPRAILLFFDLVLKTEGFLLEKRRGQSVGYTEIMIRAQLTENRQIRWWRPKLLPDGCGSGQAGFLVGCNSTRRLPRCGRRTLSG
jgi:hypothetical protein